MPPRRPVLLVRKEYSQQLIQDRVDEVAYPCTDDVAAFVDYPEEEGPTPEEAAEMCAPCPLLALCNEYAVRVERPIHGIWGGRRWEPDGPDSLQGAPLPLVERVAA